MSLQWTAVATFLYVEIILCALLMVPFITPQRWQKVFKSKILSSLQSYANLYFNIFIVILLILFFDSIRDVRKYSDPVGEEPDLKNNPQAEVAMHMKLFRAQRNFYIAGFALFLFLVLRKLVTMISKEAKLMAESAAAQAQAKSASDAAKRLLEEKHDENVGDADTQKIQEELSQYKVKVMELRNELAKGKSDMEAMKKQAEATNREYDRLTEEHAKLQTKVQQMAGEDGSKKDD